EMIEAHDGEIYFRKQKFDCFSNPNLVVALEEIINPAHIVVFGVALDVCVKSAVEGFLDHDYRVSVVKDACRAIDPETGRRLLKNWEQRGTKIISTNQLPV
ncbi:MAG: cysteine hydrolase family protein, partial [bacterium]